MNDEGSVLQALRSRLVADATLATLLSVGEGTAKIRTEEDLEDGATPTILLSLVSDSPQGGNENVRTLLVEATVRTRADRISPLDPVDPMTYTLEIKRRIRDVLLGSGGAPHARLDLPGGGCATLFEDAAAPLRKDPGDEGEYWSAGIGFRVVYKR